MRTIIAVSVASLLTSALSAQAANFLGFAAGFNTSYTDRGGQNAADVDILQVFATRDYRHWMIDPNDPLAASKRFVGFRYNIQDQIGNTPEQYTLVGYTDDPLNPGQPNVDPTGAGQWFRTGAINTPPSTATAAAVFTVTIGINPPSTPMNFGAAHGPTDDNVYLGLGLTAGTWPADGIGLHMAFDFNVGNTGTNALDVVGPRVLELQAPQANLVYTVANTGLPTPLPTGQVPAFPGTIATRGGYRQLNLEILALTTGGVAVTQTNQLRYPSSLPQVLGGAAVPLGGTTNMLSGLHPDTYDATGLLPPPAGAPARADDIGFLVTERNRPNSLVIVRMAFGGLTGGFNPDGSLPLVFVPGFNAPTSKGNICVDLADPAAYTFIGFTDANGRYQQMLPLSPAARTLISSIGQLDLVWQAFVTNLAISPAEVKATGCVTQHL
jgi:hypothetical protein